MAATKRVVHAARAIAIALVAMVTFASPAAACDWAGWPPLDAVMDAASQGRPLSHFTDGEQVVGVQEVEVIARAPALPPVTSSRAGSAVVRSWGEDVGARQALNPPRAPYVPFSSIGRYGRGCSPPTHPPVGDRVLTVSVQDPDGTPDAYLIEMPAGTTIEDVAPQFETALGASSTAAVSATQRLAAVAYAWWPLAITFGLLAFVGWRLARRIARRRQG